MSVKVFIAEFLQYLQFEKRYSKHTVVSYENDLNSFISFLEKEFGEMNLREISPGLIRSWLAALKDSGMESRSINRKISALRSFFRFQKKSGRLQGNPLMGIKSLKTGEDVPAFLTHPEWEKLERVLENPVDWKEKTMALSIPLLYATGLRRSEILQLRIRQVDFSLSQIRVLGKGNKERIIPLQRGSLELLQKYLGWREADIGAFSADDFLLCREDGNQLGEKVFYNEVHRYLGLVTTLQRKSPHILRHTFATHLANAGADLNAIKELLGHSSLASTQVYTHNTIEKLKSAHKQAHPRG